MAPELRWGLVFLRCLLLTVLRHDFRNYLRTLLLGWWIQSNQTVLERLGDALERSQNNALNLLEARHLQADARAIHVARRLATTATTGLVALHLTGQLLLAAFRAWSGTCHARKVDQLLGMLMEAKASAEVALTDAIGPELAESEAWQDALVEYNVTASALAKSEQRIESMQARTEWAIQFARSSVEQWRRILSRPASQGDQNDEAWNNRPSSAREGRLLHEIERARVGLEVAMSPLPHERECKADPMVRDRPWTKEEIEQKASPHYRLYHEMGRRSAGAGRRRGREFG